MNLKISPSTVRLDRCPLAGIDTIETVPAAQIRGGARLGIVLLAATTSLALLGGFLWFARAPRDTSLVQPFPVPLRGEPINTASQTDSLAAGVISNAQPSKGDPQSASSRKRHPKPASFQHRMVEFQVSRAEGSDAQAAAGFGGTPAKVIFSPAQLAALSEPALPPDCEKMGFETLSGFPFEMTKEMADGAGDLSAASAATAEEIPARVRALDAHLVAIRGFLLPLKMNNGLAIEFLLMRNQNMCCFGSVPKVNEWICVEPDGEGVKPIMDQPITIMGKLRVGEIRENGYLVGIYKMQAAQVYTHGVN